MRKRGFGQIMRNEDVKIYIATHKKFHVPKIDGYQAIEVGAALRDNNWDFLKDNEGDNISNKNESFCELTALYWMWKHSKSNIIGLVHYRRYFSSRRIDGREKFYLQKNEILSLLEKYDVILPEKFYWRKHTVETGYYAGEGVCGDLQVIAEIINEKYPEYILTYSQILQEKDASYCNMFIMSREMMNKYCEWLFDILFEAEKRIDINDYTQEEKRIFGYISEILLNVWVRYNKFRVLYKPIVFLGGKGKKYRLLKYVEKIGAFRKCTQIVNCMDGML